ncbi:MAG: SAM-dependent DNA methyltransferase [Kiritimatiellaeota bacterium]|nr:SAM-dependent DNA methyltransferase [Kiritimatiellota bacterium]
MSAEQQVISRQRTRDHGEVYTAAREVNAMLDLVKAETERIESRFLEPACGNGNFLVEVLKRKLAVVADRYSKSQAEFDRYAVLAVSSLYGIDILRDNVEACRERLFSVFNGFYQKTYKADASAAYAATARYILGKNIVWGDALDLRRGDGSGEAIIFSEWSPVNGAMMKRRDFTFEGLVEDTVREEDTLFRHTSDSGKEVFIPKPIKEHDLTHYLRLVDVHDEL